MKLSFLAPSGYGKDTAVSLLKKHYNIENIKIGTPLYELQNYFYEKLGLNIGDKQDGELLQFFGIKVRKESPGYLLDIFQKQVLQYNDDKNLIITNDDCRTYDYECLKDLGFIFIKINGFKRNRLDKTDADRSLLLEWKSDIPYDYEVDNFSSLEEYEKNLISLIEVIKNDRKMLCYTRSKQV